MSIPVTAVRPYLSDIRTKMFSNLSQAGYPVDEQYVLDKSLSDQDLMNQLGDRHGHMLLIPYNATGSDTSLYTTGLDIVYAIHANLPMMRNNPIVMPVSNMTSTSLKVRLNKDRAEGRLPSDLDSRILFVAECDMDRPQLPNRIRQHIENCLH